MKQHTVMELIEAITAHTGLNQGDIADRIGYSRPHLNRVIHGNIDKPERIMGRLRKEFAEILDPMYITTTAKPSQVVKTQKDDQLTQRVESLEKRVAEIEAQLKVIISLLRK